MDALQNSSTPLRYVLEQRNGPSLKLSLPQRILLEWRNAISKFPHLSYLELLRTSHPDLPFNILPDCSRLEERFRVLSCSAYNQCRVLKGAVRQRQLQRVRVINVFPEEMTNVSGLSRRLEEAEKENEELRRKIGEVDERCEELLLELLEARMELEKEQGKAQDLEIEAEALGRENADLKNYLDHLEEQVVCSNCSGDLANQSKPIHQLGERQKIRKIKVLGTRAEKALWFMNSFGAKLDSLTVVDKQGNTHQLPIGNMGNSKSVFSQLSETEKDKIRAILYIMDRFCVSDAAYHEFTMTINGLEKSYLVKQCRNDLNNIIHITRTPGMQPGAQMSFREELTHQLRQVLYGCISCY